MKDQALQAALDRLVEKGVIYVSLKWDGRRLVEVYRPIIQGVSP